MYYELPKDVKARLEEIKNSNEHIDEFLVLNEVIKIEEFGYSVGFEELKTRDDVLTKVCLNDLSVSFAFNLVDLHRVLNTVYDTIYAVHKNIKNELNKVVA